MTTNIIISDLEALKQAVSHLTGHAVKVLILKSKNRHFGIGQSRCVERFNHTYTLLHKKPTLLLRAVSVGQYSLIAAYLPRAIARKPLLEMLRIPVQKTGSADSFWSCTHRIGDDNDATRAADYFSVSYGIGKTVFSILDWGYETYLKNHKKWMHYARGKTLGGSATVNAQMWVLGNPKDFDNWV